MSILFKTIADIQALAENHLVVIPEHIVIYTDTGETYKFTYYVKSFIDVKGPLP